MFDQQGDISDDDSDEPSSSHAKDDALASFREQWQQELRISNKKKQDGEFKNSKNVLQDKKEEENIEKKAKTWYLKGAELEKAGIFYEAIQCYKKAVQLVPDIEFKVCQKPTTRVETFTSQEDAQELYHPEEDSDDEEIKDGAVFAHIQRKMAKSLTICEPGYEQRAMHISSLPTEILLYIFKWVVSSDLDLRSLEICSMVSRGFYLVARDSEIWKLSCLRVWGANCGTPTSNYPTWREMFIHRPRLHFNGCYISKTTYIRHGENSFQDQFYRPWHLVTYYRYLRFFPDGTVLMLTTPDEPHQSVSLLKNRNGKTPLSGHYRLKDDRVILVVQDQKKTAVKKGKNVSNKWQHENGEQTFHLEFQILNGNNKRKHMQLVWKYYDIFIENKNGTVSKSGFDIVNSRFPPLWFSRVKSYTKETDSCLI